MSTISLFSVLILLVLEVHSIPSYFPNIHYDLSSVVHRITGRSDGRVDRSVEMISWEPRAVIYHNFLSKDECEHVINIAKPHMKKSTVIDKIKGEIEDKWYELLSLLLLNFKTNCNLIVETSSIPIQWTGMIIKPQVKKHV
ncbi:putative procollagen-proline 4-dioxygenase [Helianthus annuus]|nr:putative procollagen-proline 4-dioxygenase [Helianthus annuus]